MKNPERDKNIKRIADLQTALRHTGCGSCPRGFGNYTLNQISNELRARIEVENFCLQMDEPSYFAELVKDGKEVVLRKIEELEEKVDDCKARKNLGLN